MQKAQPSQVEMYNAHARRSEGFGAAIKSHPASAISTMKFTALIT
jgi:hypothetical protein